MFLTPVADIIQTIVSQKSLVKEACSDVSSWSKIELAYEEKQLITGYLDHQVQKGYVIRFGDIQGFSPRYQFDLCEYSKVPDVFLNTPIKFSILKLDVEEEQLIVSRIEAVQINCFNYLSSLTKGDILDGTVTAVMDKLVTVNLSGLTCLISRSEVSWEPFNHPSEVIAVGERVSVKLLRAVPSKAYLTASIKQLDNSCWDNFISTHDVGDEVEVTVSSVSDFGYFVTYNNKLTGILNWSVLTDTPTN